MKPSCQSCDRGSKVPIPVFHWQWNKSWAEARVTLGPVHKTTDRVNKKLSQCSIIFQKVTKLQTTNPLTLAWLMQHYTTHNGAVKRWTSELLMVTKKPKQCRVKPSEDNEEDRVSMWVFKSTNAWWRLIHMLIEIFNQKWVDPYSQTCTVEWKHIIANHL